MRKKLSKIIYISGLIITILYCGLSLATIIFWSLLYLIGHLSKKAVQSYKQEKKEKNCDIQSNLIKKDKKPSKDVKKVVVKETKKVDTMIPVTKTPEKIQEVNAEGRITDASKVNSYNHNDLELLKEYQSLKDEIMRLEKLESIEEKYIKMLEKRRK